MIWISGFCLINVLKIWISIYDTKKVDLENKLLTAKLYRRAIESLDEFVEEELEHAKKKKSV